MKINIKNPYLKKGKFLWKHNDDSKLGGKIVRGSLVTDKYGDVAIVQGRKGKKIIVDNNVNELEWNEEDIKEVY